MKIAVLYNLVEKATDDVPLPNNWAEILMRFRDSYLKHSAGVQHDLFICASGAALSEHSKRLFEGMNYRSLKYLGKGWDIGAYQHCAKKLNNYDLVVFMNSQAFVVADRWLSYFTDAYAEYGPGIYGASSSFEVAPCVRTSAFAAPARLLLRYPLKVRTRYDACVFEHSPKNFSQWAIEQGLPVQVVMRSGTYQLADSRWGANIFRRGTQEDLIINDRHTLIYAQASDVDRKRLEQLADGMVPIDFIFQSRLKRFAADFPIFRRTWRIVTGIKRRIGTMNS